MYILVIDTGSSSMRSALMDAEGKILFSAKKEYYMSLGADGSCEMEPEIFEEALYEVCKKTAAWAESQGKRPEVISLTSQRSSVLAVSEEKRPLGNIIMWHDKRASGLCGRFQEEYGDEIYEISGTRLTPILSAPKMAMLRERQSDLYQKAWKLLGIHDYLLMLMTGLPFTDISLASRSSLLDVAKGKWSQRLLTIFNVSQDKLCELGRPGETAGRLADSFAVRTGLPPGIPVISAGGDQQCSVLGQGLTEQGQIGVTVGTGAYACMVLDAPRLDERKQINLNAAAVKDRWIMEASTYSSGLVYDWFNQNFYGRGEENYDAINEAVRSVPPGSGAVIMLPYLSGKGCPDWDAYARGMFCNLSADVTKAEFARAALEGVASEVSECIKVLSGFGDGTVPWINLSGGLTKLSVFDQMVSDMTGYPVRVLENGETTVLGAWMQAAVSVGLYGSQREIVEILPLFRKGETYRPDRVNGIRYGKIHEARKLIYQSLPHQELARLLENLD